ncbi:MAG: hypothetical protein WAT79_02035 [Saprospiraceae bacterium]
MKKSEAMPDLIKTREIFRSKIKDNHPIFNNFVDKTVLLAIE